MATAKESRLVILKGKQKLKLMETLKVKMKVKHSKQQMVKPKGKLMLKDFEKVKYSVKHWEKPKLMDSGMVKRLVTPRDLQREIVMVKHLKQLKD